MKWILSLLVCWSASAQLPVMPYVIPNSGISADLTGVAYRWVASDLTTNTAISGNWNDRIQNAAWLMGAVANQPTNSALGIWFDATHYLTNNLLTIGTNVAFGFILNLVAPAQGNQTHPSILNNTSKLVVDNGSVIGLMFDANASSYALSVQANATFTHLSESPFSDTNQITDLVCSQCITNTAGPSYNLAWTTYTNGIRDAQSVGAGNPPGGGKYWGSAAGTPPTPAYPNSLGKNAPRSTSARFRLSELWIWTNSVISGDGQDLSTTLRANFHKYATNTYGFSP